MGILTAISSILFFIFDLMRLPKFTTSYLRSTHFSQTHWGGRKYPCHPRKIGIISDIIYIELQGDRFPPKFFQNNFSIH